MSIPCTGKGFRIIRKLSLFLYLNFIWSEFMMTDIFIWLGFRGRGFGGRGNRFGGRGGVVRGGMRGGFRGRRGAVRGGRGKPNGEAKPSEKKTATATPAKPKTTPAAVKKVIILKDIHTFVYYLIS